MDNCSIEISGSTVDIIGSLCCIESMDLSYYREFTSPIINTDITVYDDTAWESVVEYDISYKQTSVWDNIINRYEVDTKIVSNNGSLGNVWDYAGSDLYINYEPENVINYKEGITPDYAECIKYDTLPQTPDGTDGQLPPNIMVGWYDTSYDENILSSIDGKLYIDTLVSRTNNAENAETIIPGQLFTYTNEPAKYSSTGEVSKPSLSYEEEQNLDEFNTFYPTDDVTDDEARDNDRYSYVNLRRNYVLNGYYRLPVPLTTNDNQTVIILSPNNNRSTTINNDVKHMFFYNDIILNNESEDDDINTNTKLSLATGLQQNEYHDVPPNTYGWWNRRLTFNHGSISSPTINKNENTCNQLYRNEFNFSAYSIKKDATTAGDIRVYSGLCDTQIVYPEVPNTTTSYNTNGFIINNIDTINNKTTICEIIIFSGILTEASVLEYRDYLLNKWFETDQGNNFNPPLPTFEA
jgi:hypothetical protein